MSVVEGRSDARRRQLQHLQHSEALIAALRDFSVTGLTCVSNNAGVDGFGLDLLLRDPSDQEDDLVYVGEEQALRQRFLSGELGSEFAPQGTLAERLRAGGASIPPSSRRPASARSWPEEQGPA